MRPWSSGMIRNSEAGPSSWHGAAIAPWCALLRMKHVSSASAPPCRPFVPNGYALVPCFCRRTSRAIGWPPAKCAKSSNGTPTLIEPLSLDEAYLDVSQNKTGLPTATQVARTIREQIRSELSLTASAGVAPNRFLAKIASDWKKPDGLFVIQPEEINSFLLPLPVDRLPGVGKVTEEKLKHLEVQTIADLRRMDLATLEDSLGRYGVRLYQLARGIDNSEVIPDRPTQSISAEDTFEQDVLLAETEPMIRKLAEHAWTASRKESRIARTVVLKLKTSEFKILTRSHTPSSPPDSCEELTNVALSLLKRVGLSPHQRFRLVGVGLSNFCDPENASAQPALFT